MGTSSPPLKGKCFQFLTNVCCGQTAGWTKMPLGMDVGFGPGDFVLDGDPAPLRKGHSNPPLFGPCLLWPWSPILATAKLLFYFNMKPWLNTMLLGPRPTSLPCGILMHPAIWPEQTWAENWGAVSLWGRGAGPPANTMWPGPRHTFHLDPSKRLATIHQRHRQDRTDGQWSDSIGSTVLQMVAQKSRFYLPNCIWCFHIV